MEQTVGELLSKDVQFIANLVLTKKQNKGTSMSTLSWKEKARKTKQTTYLRIAGARKLKEDAKDKSKTDRVTRKADKIEQSLEQTLKNVDEETDRGVFRNLAKRRK